MRPGRREGTAPEWGRNKLLALVAGVAVVVLLLVVGLALAVVSALHRTGRGPATARPPTAAAAAYGSVRAEQDALAAAPMPAGDLSAAQPTPVSTRDPGVIVLPNGTATGVARVPTGFPQTPEGALAQLAALDRDSLQSGTLGGVRAVIRGWAATGGPDAETWSMVEGMANFLTAAGLSGGGSPQLAIVATPLMGLIKGHVGDDFAVVCVVFEVDATLQETRRVAVTHCQRMVWQGRRWLVGPGPEPAPGPAAWPDSDLAVRYGYRDLRHG
jgi:hypothetical protein